MIVKSGLEFFISKFYQPLQSYLLTCQANSAFLGRFFFCTGQQQLWRGLVNFKIKNSRPLFTIIFESKVSISRLDILVHCTYWKSSSWCVSASEYCPNIKPCYKFLGLTRRTLTNEERKKLLEMGHSQHVTASSITLLIVKEVDEILYGNEDKYKGNMTTAAVAALNESSSRYY